MCARRAATTRFTAAPDMDALAAAARTIGHYRATIDLSVHEDGVRVLTASLGGRQITLASTQQLRQYAAIRWPFPLKCLFCRGVGGCSTAMVGVVKLHGVREELQHPPAVTLSLRLANGGAALVLPAGNATLFSYETGAATFNAAARRYEVPVRFRLNIVSKRFNGSDFIVVAHVAVAGYTLRGETIPITVTSKMRGRKGRSTDLDELLRRHAEALALHDFLSAKDRRIGRLEATVGALSTRLRAYTGGGGGGQGGEGEGEGGGEGGEGGDATHTQAPTQT